MATMLLTACGNTDKNKGGEETAQTSEVIEEYTGGSYDWTQLSFSAKGEGRRTSGKVPYAYDEPDGYYQTYETNKVSEGVRRMLYSVKLTGLQNETMMANINTVITEAQNALKDDISWISEEKKEDLLAAVEDAAKVEPMNYAATGVTVFGHVLSVNILYLHIYNVSNGDGEHLADETVDEGRLLMNFNLRTGKVIRLPELFYDDVDYVALLSRYMNKVGGEVGYRFSKPINGLPDEYDVFCLSGTGLVMGLAEGNPYIRGSEETWFSINLSDLIADMDVDPAEARLYFNEDVVFQKLAFRVKDISFAETEVKDIFSENNITLPLVAGISTAETINADLRSWYQSISDRANYTDVNLDAGGSISAETQAPCGLVNVTVFIYTAAANQYITLARCYDAKTGQRLTVGDLLTGEAKAKYGSGVVSATSFRVSNTFIIGVPEQEGVDEYFLTEEGEMDLSRFE